MRKVTNLNQDALLKKPGRHRVADNLFVKVLDPDRAYWVVRYSVRGASREVSLGSARKFKRTDVDGRYYEIMAEVEKNAPVASGRNGALLTKEEPEGICCV